MSHFHCLVCTNWWVQPWDMCFRFITSPFFLCWGFVSTSPNPQTGGPPLVAVRDCLFNIFAVTLHIGGRSSLHNLRTRHTLVTGTHLSWKINKHWLIFKRGRVLPEFVAFNWAFLLLNWFHADCSASLIGSLKMISTYSTFPLRIWQFETDIHKMACCGLNC